MGMVRRRTRRRTMMVAGGMAHERGQSSGQPDTYEDQPASAEPPPAPPAPAAVDPSSELERLAGLHDSGALSDEEFAQAKQNVLGG